MSITIGSYGPENYFVIITSFDKVIDFQGFDSSDNANRYAADALRQHEDEVFITIHPAGSETIYHELARIETIKSIKNIAFLLAKSVFSNFNYLGD